MSQQNKNMVPLAEAGILLVTILWGITFPLVRWLVDAKQMDVWALMAWRFGLAGLLLSPILVLRWRWLHGQAASAGDTAYHSEQRKMNFTFWWHSAIISTVAVIAFGSQTLGMQYTTAANSSIITSLNIVFIPLLAPLFGRVRPGAIVYFAVFLCFLGVSLLTDLRNLGMPGRGDVLTFICAVCFAIDIILIALWARDHDPILFGLAQLGLAGLFHLILAIVMQSPFAIPSGALVQVLVLSLLCSGVTAVVSVWGQRHISESHCALIFSLEPMVGAGLGILILKEPFGWELALGGALVMAGILMARPDAKRSSPESMHDHIEAVNAMHAAGGGIHAAQAIEKAPS